MAKPNYQFEKRQREQQKKQKKEEKAQRKMQDPQVSDAAESTITPATQEASPAH